MQNNKIASSIEWSSVRTDLYSSAHHNIPEFNSDIFKLLKSIDEDVRVLSIMEVEVRAHRKRANSLTEQLQIVNTKIKNFQKFYMIALMSRELH